MNKNQSSWNKAFKAVATMLVAATAFAPAVPALAKVEKVTGVDYLYTKEDDYTKPATTSDGFVDLVSVASDDSNEVVYVDLLDAKDRVMASHLGYKLGDYTVDDKDAGIDPTELVGTDDPNGNGYVAMLSADIDLLDTNAVYTIKVYTNREDPAGSNVFTGKIRTYFASFSDEPGANPAPIVVRTSDGTSPKGCPAPATLTHNNKAYTLDSETDTDGVFSYTLKDDGPEQFEGGVSYLEVGATDDIKTDKITLKKGETQEVSIPPMIEANGNYYRTLSIGNTVKLSYPGVSRAAIYVLPLTGDWSAGAPYSAKINYVLDDGTEILSDSLLVDKPYTYTLPNTVYKVKDGVVHKYTLKDAADSVINFLLGAEDKDRTANALYEEKDLSNERMWVITYIDGREAANDGGSSTDRTYGEDRIIKTVEVRESDTNNGMYAVPKTLTVKDSNDKETELECVLGDNNIDLTKYNGTVEVYYVDANATPENFPPYDVTVNYVNIANGETIRTQSAKVKLTDKRSDAELDFTVPATFASDGVEWVILAGQLNGGPDQYHLYHSYYTGYQDESRRSYNVYFRDVNDDLHEATVITTIRTVYDTVVTDLGTTATAATAAPAATAAAPAATAAAPAAAATTAIPANATPTAALTNDGGLQSITGANTNGVVRNNGTSVETERIVGPETPTAGPTPTNSGTPGASTIANLFANAPAVLASVIAAVVGIVLFALYGKRKEENSGNDTEKVE
ncbi:MAG: hypothetical protein IKE22_13565 [Atopobiaceae bacterium]|nr:hypothetical protein [Atopobiaceae bacterium]